jgi:triphosphatase
VIVAQEVELKLELDRRSAAVLEKQALYRNADTESQRQVSIYYDTVGGKLRKRGLTLRVRSTKHGYVQTVKSINSGAGLFSRGEWEAPVESMEPQVEQLERTPAGELKPKKLRPIIRSEVKRTTWRSKQGDSLLEFAFDDGRLAAGPREASIFELEIELLKGDAARAFEVARSLAEDVPLKIGVLSKAERGFALADDAFEKITKASPVDVRADIAVAEGSALIAHSCIRHFRLNEPIVLRRRDPAALHQVRVAMRRLRAALSIFRPALEDSHFDGLRDELRWFTGQLGDARNLDVYLEQKRLSAGVRKALGKERRLAYDRVIEALQSKRLRMLMIDLAAWIAVGKWRHSEKAKRPLASYATRRIGRIWQKVAAHGELQPMQDAERHELRIEIKKLRYALEFVEPLHAGVGRRQMQFGKAVEALQDALGVLNDLVTTRAIATAAGDSRALARLADAEVHNKCLHEAQACLDRLRKIGPYWSKVG